MWNFVDMSGWKMWEHGVPDSRIIILNVQKIKDMKMGAELLDGSADVLVEVTK